MKKEAAILVILFVVAILSASFSIAHEAGEEEEGCGDGCAENTANVLKSEFIKESAMNILLICSVLVAIFSIISIIVLRHTNKYNLFLYSIIAISVLIATFSVTYATIYSNVYSKTGGPVHWHADYEVWSCGDKLDLVNPEGMSNRIGTSVFHEHGDDRIHVEGVVEKLSDASLGEFFETVGGDFHNDIIKYPTEDRGIVSFKNGDFCPDGSVGKLNIFVNGKRIDNPEDYVLSPEENVPPGDCIIIDFSSSDSKTTDKICNSWKIKNKHYE